ncbi:MULTISPECIES: AAA family ATPase [unclassified Bradyrhizobium]|uniref:AAA family ATPase n=1 Tax=unclassified Bradyrhizobium TaxID=2631580 RepID=UPI002FF33EA9
MTDDIYTAMMMAERPPHGSRERTAEAPDRATGSVVGRTPAGMGPLELEQYKKEWRASYRFRSAVAEVAAERAIELMRKKLQDEALAAAERAMGQEHRVAGTRGLAKLREAARRSQEDDDEERLPSKKPDSKLETYAISAGEVAASLIFARLFDKRPQLLAAVRSAAPTVVLDIPDVEMLGRVGAMWQSVLYPDPDRLMDVQRDTAGRRARYDAVYLLIKEVPKGKDKPAAETAALSALTLALPFFALSPLGTTHLPQTVLKAACERIEFPPMDPATIARVIRIITGKPCRENIAPDLAARTSVSDLIVAVRFDRSPSQCLAELRRLAAAKDTNKKSRDLTLAQLHGLGEARAWAESAIADIKAWKAGEIGWDAVSSAVALTGPPGTGKTTFAKVFAAEVGLALITATLAKWQSSGDAHLGHLLRAMRQDFDAARTQAPCVLFIDEVDSFPDRASLTHSHKDYVIEVVNALLEQVDGIAGREGVIVIGASNDLSRCDPALLRSGRLDKVVRIGLPTQDELEKMLRVRLAGALADADLRPIVELAVGMTGADIERVVKDARRVARQASRAVTLEDLRGALVEEDPRPPELRWRVCVHEAAHIVADVLNFGPDDVFATSAYMGSRGGISVRTNLTPQAGTYDDYHKRLQVILAGRVGEELLLGAGSHGAGGEPDSDLDQATRIAAAMAGSLGLAGPTPLTFRGPKREAQAFLAFEEIRTAVNGELAKAASACRLTLDANRDALEAVAMVLFERGRVDGAEVAELLRSHPGGNPGPGRPNAIKPVTATIENKADRNIVGGAK